MTDLSWQDSAVVASQTLTLDAASAYCDTLDFAGVQDWRLSDFNELYAIVDGSRTDPAIDPVFQNVALTYYWSSFTFGSGAWGVFFSNGSYGWNDSTASKHARCVRNGQTIPLNTAPIATDNSYSINEDETVNANVIIDGTSDSDLEGDMLHVSANTNPSHGTLNIDTNGSFTYIPTANYNGTDSFVYTVSDGSLEDNATVQITIGAVNDIPVITEGESINITMSEDGSPTAFALTLNATDNDGDVITWSIKTGASHGSATAIGTGNSKIIDYIPLQEYYGSDSFVVEITDGNGADEINVTVTIQSVNDAPVALDDTASTYENIPVTIDVHSNDSDIEGDTLTFSIMTSPAHGSAQSFGNNIVYTSNEGYVGADSFIYTVSDGNGGSAQGSVTVTVSAMDDDGVDESVGVDGNHNGVEDRFESHVVTLFSQSIPITIATQATASLTNISTSGGSVDANLSDGKTITLPFGIVSFTATGLSVGGTANIELFYPYDESIIGYAKELNDGMWHDVAATVIHNSIDNYTQVSFSIIDGSEFDFDGSANGEVKDPGGVYRLVQTPPLTTVSVPLSPTAKAVLVLLFTLSAWFMMRRRRAV